tara:strand:- start:2975 stop:3940 length:966 start_codon:yes stop_codon:yes gene_type:complete
MGTIISESISARLVSDKPIKKTPYQVKGVFMKQFADEKIVPFLDGKLRNKYLYPRVQVKILDEQIYIVGINEGVDPVLSLINNLEFINFGDITVKIENIDIEQNKDPVSLVDKLLRYKFVTPWVALNAGSSKKFNSIEEDKKILFLNKLLGQNLLFLSKELGLDTEFKIYTKIEVDSMDPHNHEENGWRSFNGEFRTNFMLPNFIGFGNGITRGYGSIFSLNHSNNLEFQNSSKEADEYTIEDINEDDNAISSVTMNDAPVISNRKKKKRFKSKKKGFSKNNRSQRRRFKGKNDNVKKQEIDIDDESRFNSEEYHQKQHDL